MQQVLPKSIITLLASGPSQFLLPSQCPLLPVLVQSCFSAGLIPPGRTYRRSTDPAPASQPALLGDLGKFLPFSVHFCSKSKIEKKGIQAGFALSHGVRPHNGTEAGSGVLASLFSHASGCCAPEPLQLWRQKMKQRKGSERKGETRREMWGLQWY